MHGVGCNSTDSAQTAELKDHCVWTTAIAHMKRAGIENQHYDRIPTFLEKIKAASDIVLQESVPFGKSQQLWMQ